MTDPRKVLAGGFAEFIVLILLDLSERSLQGQKRRLRQLWERKDEAESDENKKESRGINFRVF